MFPGSHDMLVRENEELDRLQLPRIADDYELTRYELAQELVPVSETDGLKFAPDLPDNRHYCRPWTREFLQDFTEAYYNEFHCRCRSTRWFAPSSSSTACAAGTASPRQSSATPLPPT